MAIDGIEEPVLVGKREIAALLGVERTTPTQWVRRGRLPGPDHPPVNGLDTWYRSTIESWARATDRWPDA